MLSDALGSALRQILIQIAAITIGGLLLAYLLHAVYRLRPWARHMKRRAGPPLGNKMRDCCKKAAATLRGLADRLERWRRLL